MTAVRYDMNEGRNRPVRRGRVPPHVFIRHCEPPDCDHPIAARVKPVPNPYGYIARCHDCGLHQRGDHWVVDDDGAVRHRTTWEIAL